MHQPDDLLTIEEAANHLRTPVATMRYWRHKGIGPESIKLGRRIVYPYRDLIAWVNAQRGDAA